MSLTQAGTPSAGSVFRIVRSVGGYRWWVAATALLSFITLGAGIGLLAMSAFLISKSALVDSTIALALTILGVRIFAMTRAVSRYAERYVGHLGTFRILTRIRIWFFRGIEPLAPAVLSEHRSGDLLTRLLSDIDTLQDLYLRVLVPPVAAALAVSLGCILLAGFSPWLGVVLFVFVCLCGIAIPLAMQRLSRSSSVELLHEQANLNATLVEGISGIADLVAFGREDLLLGTAGSITAAQEPARKKLAQARGIAAGLTALLVGLAALTVVGFGVSLVSAGSLDGVYLAILPLVAIATFEAVGPLGAAYEHLDRSRAAANRLVDLVDTTPTVLQPTQPAVLKLEKRGSPAHAVADLEISNLSFRYSPSEPLVLNDASLEIPAGSFVVITGPSGSGKSTLANLLLRFWEYSQGSIQLSGAELNQLDLHQARSAVSLVAQHDHLFDTTLRDNLLVGDSLADEQRLLVACDAVCLGNWIRSLPAGLDERAGENGNRLSGGERQRLMIARALLAEAPILILDEATEHLDAEMQLKVLDGVLNWRSGLTTVLITHEYPQISDVDIHLHCRNGSFSEL
jgi:thiol reductant ABC exporter CydC subunit